MEIRNSKIEELTSIEEVYGIARKFMKETGNPNQWKDSEPTREKIVEDIENGNHYVVLSGGEIVGCFSLIAGDDPTYGYIEGSWLNDESYSTIHKVASKQKVKGIFDLIIDYCQKQNNNLRIDTYKDNKIMQHNILKNGFEYCGTIYLANGEPRMAYQKIIK